MKGQITPTALFQITNSQNTFANESSNHTNFRTNTCLKSSNHTNKPHSQMKNESSNHTNKTHSQIKGHIFNYSRITEPGPAPGPALDALHQAL
jgi:hypothetical protein